MINEENIIESVLESIYKKELILIKKFHRVKENLYEILVAFPEYRRAISPAQHVSTNQISEVLLESLYCASAYSINEGTLNIGISFDEFLAEGSNFILRNINITCHKILVPYEEFTFTIEVIRSNIRMGFCIVLYRLDGFMKGSVKCIFKQ